MDNLDPTTPIPLEGGAPDVTAAFQSGIAGEELVRVLDQYLADLESGATPDRHKLLAEHPTLASQLEACLSGIEFIHRAARPAGEAPAQLGDFAIVREVGRGGMGVVYEAEQLSLKRKVALKVLRFAGVADRDAMERFQREAETVAHLHHTNIVPIFAVGEQNGVFYYAMQFIEGRSLAAVLEESQKEAAPLDLIEATGWAMQAAEALAHAHQRNVIHRDVKPSNLILDPAGQIWLTDFGLAKRMDDVTLSTAGTLLGTPRYMSPEQASAATRPVDQRSDIYSLGATLYELATGKPLFDANSAHAIITQILTAEPEPPRRIRTNLPRDLETIILKCLAKDASARYPAAQALVDDLRAFCEGRAIKARRASIAERTVRWARKRKKSAAIASIAAAVTLAVAIGSYLAVSSWANARQARISVATVGDQHFKVELLDEAEQKTIAALTAPTQEAHVIPPGHYHVRISAAGQLSETSQLDAGVGGYYSVTAALSPRNLWDISLAQNETAEMARLDGRDDVLLANRDELRRLHGGTAEVIWRTSLAAKDQPLVEKAFRGMSGRREFFLPNYFGSAGAGWEPPCLVRPQLDLDNDGTPDLIWASRTTAALAAVSGKSGKLLWCHDCRAALPDNLREKDIQIRQNTGQGIFGNVVGRPMLVEADGKKLVVSLFALAYERIGTESGKWFDRQTQLWIEAVDAPTGATVWRRQLEWLPGATDRNVLFATTAWKQADRDVAAMVCGNRLFGYEVLTGKPTFPDRKLDDQAPLGAWFANLRGGPEPEVVLLRDAAVDGNSAGVNRGFGPRGNRELKITVLSPRAPAPLWERPLTNCDPVGFLGRVVSTDWDWPAIVDLNSKEKAAIVVPFVDYESHSSGIELLDGSTGESRWKRPLARVDENWQPAQTYRVVAGSDLDGDGCRELFAASYEPRSGRIYVDALSGTSGRILWSNQKIVAFPGQPGALLPLRWWQPSSDGWPLLVVGQHNGADFGASNGGATILAAATGRIEHELTGFGQPGVFDVNGDGLLDLIGFDLPMLAQRSGEGRLRAIKGVPPAAWRTIGRDFARRDSDRGQDYNGDGFGDLFSPDEGAAISGRNGSVLWKSNSVVGSRVVSDPLPEADLDGDGTPDLLAMPARDFDVSTKKAKIVATSGRDGRTLWSADLQMTEDNTLSHNYDLPPHLAAHILEEGHKPDVLVLYQRQRHPPVENSGPPYQELNQFRLVRLDGRNGHVVWEQSLDDFNPLDIRDKNIPFAIADLDGDGVKDVVFWLPLPVEKRPLRIKEAANNPSKNAAAETPADFAWPTFELCAISGRDGKVLWRRPGFFTNNTFGIWQLGDLPAPVVCDPKGDGNLLVLVTDQRIAANVPGWVADKRLAPNGVPGLRTEVLAIDGKSGKPAWSWYGAAAPYFHPLEQMGDWQTASPQIVRTAAGPAIAISVFDVSLRGRKSKKVQTPAVTETEGNQIVLLNMRGEELQAIDNGSQRGPANTGQRLWVHDLLGNGLDEFIWCDSRTVKALSPEAKSILWESQQMPMFFSISSIQPAGKGYPATVVVECPQAMAYDPGVKLPAPTTVLPVPPAGMVALSGLTGKDVWLCEAAYGDNGISPSLLETGDPHGLPRISAHGPGSAQTCYAAIATDDHGRYLPSEPAPRAYDTELVDRRLLHPLPWNRSYGVQDFQEDWSGTLIVALVVLAAVASIIGWWSGMGRRAAWLFGLWFIPAIAVETMRFVLESRYLAPNEHFDWSNWREVSINEWRILIGILLQIIIAWWLVRLAWWSAKRIRASLNTRRNTPA